jgi:hypothetical protein
VEKDKADKVAAEAKVAADAAAVIKEQAAGELAEAAPAMERASAAVRGLDKNSLGELKGFKAPPKGVERVTGACAMMLEGEFKKHEQWDYAKKMMADVGGFWRPLLSLLAHMRENGFIRQDTEVRYLVSEKIEDIVPMLKKATDFAARDGAGAQPLDNRL